MPVVSGSEETPRETLDRKKVEFDLLLFRVPSLVGVSAQHKSLLEGDLRRDVGVYGTVNKEDLSRGRQET